MCSTEVAKTIHAGDHGTTYGGNLLACRAALVFLDASTGGLLAQMPRLSTRLFGGLRRLRERHGRLVREVRGAGLIAGLDLHDRRAAGRRGRARTRAARQPDVHDGRAPAAAVHRDGSGHRRGARHPGRRAHGRLGKGMTMNQHDTAALRLKTGALSVPLDTPRRQARASRHRPEHGLRHPRGDAGRRRRSTRSSTSHLRRRPSSAPRAGRDPRAMRGRFVVCEVGGAVKACAELAPLSADVAEVRSLVVAAAPPRRARRAAGRGAPRAVRAPRASTPSARSRTTRGSSCGRGSRSCRMCGCRRRSRTDCLGCPLFRRVRPDAMVLPLRIRRAHGAVTAGPRPWPSSVAKPVTRRSRRRHRPAGFRAAGVACGIKKASAGALDLAIARRGRRPCRPPRSSRPTRPWPRPSWSRASISRESGGRAPGRRHQQRLRQRRARARRAWQCARETAAATAAALGCAPAHVLVASTGVIGVQLDRRQGPRRHRRPPRARCRPTAATARCARS